MVAYQPFRIYWQALGPPNGCGAGPTYLHISRVGLNDAQSCFGIKFTPTVPNRWSHDDKIMEAAARRFEWDFSLRWTPKPVLGLSSMFKAGR
jgi:hypothetical protein